MKLNLRLRRFWHDLYYKGASPRMIRFAMTCQDTTEKVDLNERPTGLLNRFRWELHLSLCQACKCYFEMSHALQKAARDYTKTQDRELNVDRLNESLLKKYSSSTESSKG